jgi:hypothetical protein
MEYTEFQVAVVILLLLLQCVLFRSVVTDAGLKIVIYCVV